MAAPPSPHPLQLLLQEQAKFMVAVKELQDQVHTLQDFRSRVLMAFPQLDNIFLGGGVRNQGNLVPLNRKSPGCRILPSVQVAVSKCQQASSSSPGRQAPLKPQSIRRGREYANETSMRHPPVDRAGKKFVVVAQGKNWLRIRPYSASNVPAADSELDDSDDEQNSTSDSLHSVAGQRDKSANPKGAGRGKNGGMVPVTTGVRQDSGFSTDGRVSHHHDVSSSDVRWSKEDEVETEDELMTILDAIGRKSVYLRSQVERAAAKSCHGVTLADIGLKPEDVLAEVDRLRAEREQLLERLISAESERAMYSREVVRLRESLVDKETIKRALEERMEVVSAERERLRTEIRRLHTQFAPKNNNGSGNGGSQIKREKQAAITTTGSALKPARLTNCNGPNSLPDRLGRTKLKVHMDRSKISAILCETRSLELQKQLLVSVLRIEVLRSQMEQNATDWQRKAGCWRQREATLQAESEIAGQSNVQLQIKVHQMETELQTERSKRQVLERALQAAYKDLTHANTSRELPSSAPEIIRPVVVENEKFVDRNSPAFQTWKHATYGKLTSGSLSSSKGCSRSTPLSRFKETVSRDSIESEEESSSVLLDTLKQSMIEAAETFAATSLSPPPARLLENGDEIKRAEITRREPNAKLSPRRRQSLTDPNCSPKKTPGYKHEQRVTPMPKTKAPYYYVPRCSHSAEDIRDSDWDWTYDLTHSGPEQHSRMSYVVLQAQGLLHGRALSEART